MNNNTFKPENFPIIECDKISKTYRDGQSSISVVHKVSFKLHRGESIAIVGASGSGKSTLLQLMGGLDAPTSGQIKIMGRNIAEMNAKEIGMWRNQNLGFIYQFHHLLPEFTALENVMMPLLIAGQSKKKATERSKKILEIIGLSARLDHRPSELSGGERQRVSIARAVVNNPLSILADEPTGNLDKKNAYNVINLLKDLRQQLKLSFIVVTHDESLIPHFDRILTLSDGNLITN